jgi:hypothetical protein
VEINDNSVNIRIWVIEIFRSSPFQQRKELLRNKEKEEGNYLPLIFLP